MMLLRFHNTTNDGYSTLLVLTIRDHLSASAELLTSQVPNQVEITFYFVDRPRGSRN